MTKAVQKPTGWKRFMVNYRLYHLREGHFFRSSDIAADTDEEALQQAIERLGPDAAELWCGERKVSIFPGRRDET